MKMMSYDALVTTEDSFAFTIYLLLDFMIIHDFYMHIVSK